MPAKTSNEKAATQKEKPRKRRTSKSVITLGRHDEMALEAMYRLGGLTVSQLVRATTIGSLTAARECLRRLREGGLIEQTQDTSKWRDTSYRGGNPPSFYYLAKGQEQRAREYGGYLAGIERRKEALAGYRLHQLPARAAHASIRNEYLLALMEQAEAANAEVPWEAIWAESAPDHPLLAGEITPEMLGKQPRKNARRNPRRRLYPDGSVEVAFTGLSPATVMLEVEATRTRGERLVSKVGDYAGFQQVEGILRPLVVLARTRRLAESMRRTVRERIQAGQRSGSEAVGYYADWVRGLRQEGVQPGRIIAFTSAEEVEEAGAYEAIYHPLSEEESASITLYELIRRVEEAKQKLGIEEVA